MHIWRQGEVGGGRGKKKENWKCMHFFKEPSSPALARHIVLVSPVPKEWKHD